jgi:rRNA maturation protein Nop10
MKITACPKCGSKNIFQGTMGDGVLTGYTTKDVCRNCGYQGSPIIFDSEKEYKKFLAEFEGGIDKKKAALKEESSEKDKEVVKLLKEYEKEKCSKPIWSKKKSWWPEIIVSIIFSAFFYFFTIRPNTSYMNIEISTIYGALYVISSFVIFLLFIIFIEYILRAILGVCTTKKDKN